MTRKGTFTLQTLLLSALLIVGIGVSPAVAGQFDDCVVCHGSLEDVHGDFDHSAVLGNGPVTLFADTGHDEDGRSGSKPYFAVSVDCKICHSSDLPAIHGNDCATCHPTPYDSIRDAWNGGCQQGGCHPSYHDDAAKAHGPFEDVADAGNDCFRCHAVDGFAVSQAKCSNCHVVFAPGDVTPPVTTSNARAEYSGPARIDFSITDNGKVGVGRTFYRLDGGAATAAAKNLLVTAPGAHQLQFWSKDQSGNTEPTPTTILFTVAGDTTAPVTTSNAQGAYNYGAATISLTATDNGTLGVKNTYFRLNGGPIQTGTTVSVGTGGTHTLSFWSEDWSGNVETARSVTFTVGSGPGTIRLVWGNSDVDASQRPGADDWAGWTIRKGNLWGPVAASGSSDASPNWNGVNNIAVPVSNTPYFVIVYTWEDEEDDEIWFQNIYITNPGQVVRLSY